jgi:hypothetical protein
MYAISLFKGSRTELFNAHIHFENKCYPITFTLPQTQELPIGGEERKSGNGSMT